MFIFIWRSQLGLHSEDFVHEKSHMLQMDYLLFGKIQRDYEGERRITLLPVLSPTRLRRLQARVDICWRAILLRAHHTNKHKDHSSGETSSKHKDHARWKEHLDIITNESGTTGPLAISSSTTPLHFFTLLPSTSRKCMSCIFFYKFKLERLLL